MRSRSSLHAIVVLATLVSLVPRAQAERRNGPIIGLEIGAAGVTGTSGNVYRPGAGSALVLGMRIDRFAIEWQPFQQYSVSARDARLRSIETAGQLNGSSFTLRYLVRQTLPLAWLVGGVGTVRAPIIDRNGRAAPVSGIGPVVGVAAGYPVGAALLTLEARGYVPVVRALPPEHLVFEGDGPMGGLVYSPDSDDVTGVAWTLGLGVRVLL